MMEENDKTDLPKLMQLCRITIVFPVSDDMQAVTYKKKIVESIADITEARIDFNLVTMPIKSPNACL